MLILSVHIPSRLPETRISWFIDVRVSPRYLTCGENHWLILLIMTRPDDLTSKYGVDSLVGLVLLLVVENFASSSYYIGGKRRSVNAKEWIDDHWLC